MPKYALYNLVFDLPFVVEGIQTASGPVDVRVGMGSVPKTLADHKIRGICYEARHQRCLFSLIGETRFDIRDGSEVTVDAEPGIDKSELLYFLFGSVAAIIAVQRGLFPMNASCIASGENAVAFTGARDSGKSSIAAHLCHGNGFDFVADDLVWLKSTSSGWKITGVGYSAFKLWPRTVDSLSVDASRAIPIRPGIEKKYVPSERKSTGGEYDLSKLIVICNSEDHEGLEPVAGRKKFELGLEYMLFKEILEMELGQADYFTRVVTMFSGLELNRLYRPFQTPVSAQYAEWVGEEI